MFDCCCKQGQGGVLGLLDFKGNRKPAKKKKEKKEDNYKNIQTHFPNLNLKDGQQENVLWIPPYLIFSVITADMVEKGHDLDGPNFEQDTVYNFHSVFENFETGSRNFTVLAGWKHTWNNESSKGGTGEEHDLVIIDGQRRIILNCEIKCTITKNGSFQKAKNQLNNQTKYFEEFHCELQLGGWSFINVIVYKENVDVKFCSGCDFFTLNEDKMRHENLKIWWDKLGDKISPDTNTTKMSYEEVVERFVGPCTKVSDCLCNERQIRDKEQKTLTGSNDQVSTGILTGTLKDNKKIVKNAQLQLSKEEQDILENSNRVILTGDYGTGKTYHLLEKVKKLAKKGEKVFIVVGNIYSEHLHLEHKRHEYEGAVILQNHLAKEFNKLENHKNILIHHKVYYSPPESEDWEEAPPFFLNFNDLLTKMKKGYHLVFDEIVESSSFSENDLDIDKLVAACKEYPNQTVWIAVRPETSHFKASGFNVVHLKMNFRNSPKIIEGVNGFFDGLSLKPVSHEQRAESVFVSLNQKRLDQGSPKLVIGHCCGMHNQSLKLIRTALKTYKGDNVILIQLRNFPIFFSGEYKIKLINKHVLEQGVPEFNFVHLWKYNKGATNTCFFYLSNGEFRFHDIWNGIEVKNLIVFVGCNLHIKETEYSYSNSDSDSTYVEVLRNLMLRASVSLTVITCQEQGCIQNRFWQYGMKHCFNIVKPKDKFPKIYDWLINSFQQLQENPIDGAIAVPHRHNILVWDAVIFGLDKTPFEGGIFILQIEFFEYKTPIVNFLSKIYHPNIYENGQMELADVEIEERFNVHAVLKAVESLLREPHLKFHENQNAAHLYKDDCAEYEKQVRACVEQSLIENPDLNKVKALWKAKGEDFLTKLNRKDIFPKMCDNLINSFWQLLESPIEEAIAVPTSSNCLVWDAVIFGLLETPFAGGIFTLQIEFSEYRRQPLVKFHSKIFHPNIDGNGKMVLKYVKRKDMFNIHVILKIILSLLREPKVSRQSLITNPYLNRVKAEWKAKQEEFLRKLEGEEKEANASN